MSMLESLYPMEYNDCIAGRLTRKWASLAQPRGGAVVVPTRWVEDPRQQSCRDSPGFQKCISSILLKV